MDKITSWCKFISVFSIISSLVLTILPEGKSKGAFKTLLSFIMIYTFVSHLSDADLDLSRFSDYFNINVNSGVSESLVDYENYPLISAAESETEEYFGGILSSIGAEGYCEAACVLKEGKILLNEILVFAELNERQRKMISDEIYRIYGEETLIIFSGEQYGN